MTTTTPKEPEKLELFISGEYSLVYYGFKFLYKDQKLEGSIYHAPNETLDDSGIEFDGANEYYDPEDDFPMPPEAEEAIETDEAESFREWLKEKVIAEYKKGK